jgi:hypothetical protein
MIAIYRETWAIALSNASPDFRETVDAGVLWKPSYECAWPFRPGKRLFPAVSVPRCERRERTLGKGGSDSGSTGPEY